MMNAEQVIKQALDGLFYTFDVEVHRTRVKTVPKDHIPTHKPRYLYEEDASFKLGRQWTAAEDDLMRQMYHAGKTFKEMGRAVGVSASGANVRWREICLMDGCTNQRRNLYNSIPLEVCVRVVNMKISENLTFDQVARAMNLTRNQVAGIWRRWRKENNIRREAA